MSDPKSSHKVFTKKGAKMLSSVFIACEIREAIRNTGESVKALSNRIERTGATVKRWFAGENCPDAASLIALCREYPEVRAAVLDLMGEQHDASSASLARALARALEKEGRQPRH